MDRKLTLYHGSEKIISKPVFNCGRRYRDFGVGFYCTENEELSKEWAVTEQNDGFSNRYTLDTEYLKILELNHRNYTILNWIAILVEYRIFSVKTPVANRARQYLIDHFSLNVNAFDIVVGYRADDSYFDYTEAFLNNGITVEQLAEAMQLGKPGEQVVIKSEFAFSQLQFDGYSAVSKQEYFKLRKDRNDEAAQQYLKILNSESDGLYIQDIIRGNITNEDARIPGNISF